MNSKFNRLDSLPDNANKLPYPQPWEFVLEKYFVDQKDGFYVDVGAHNGITYSNTAHFDLNLGWSGICIEPLEKVFKELVKSRNAIFYNTALSEKEEEIEFYEIDGHAEMLSGIKDNYDKKHIKRIKKEIRKFGGNLQIKKIKTEKLQNLLDINKITKIDYLSIDTEGAELSVLQGINFEKTNIQVISCENNFSDDSVKLFLKNKGFNFVEKVCADEIFFRID